MAIFKLTSADDTIVLIVRGKCISCVRNIAASNAGPEGPRTWMDPARSTCELVRENDAPELITRSVKHDD